MKNCAGIRMPDLPREWSRCGLSFVFRKKPGASPFYVDNSAHLEACALVERILEARGGLSRMPGSRVEELYGAQLSSGAPVNAVIRLVSWSGGRRDDDCAHEGILARVEAAVDLPPGAGQREARMIAAELSAGSMAEYGISGFEQG